MLMTQHHASVPP